jgi:capsular polysaccharide biosynthesis protein
MTSVLRTALPQIELVRRCKANRLKLKAFDGHSGSDVRLVTPPEREAVISHMDSLMDPAVKTEKFRVLLIGRQTVDRQPLTDRSDTTGAQRRSIRNFDLLERILQEHFGETMVTVFLEEHSILEQYALFRNAEVVVGQHGAGLANIFFADTSYTKGLVEISPYTQNFRDGKYTHALPDCFKYITKFVNISYTRIFQKGEFSEVDELLVLKEISRILGLGR